MINGSGSLAVIGVAYLKEMAESSSKSSTSSKGAMKTISLPHTHKLWPVMKEKLQKLAEKRELGPDALAGVILASPEWGLDKPPMLSVLKKVLGKGDHYTVESFSEDILPYIAKRALAVEELFSDQEGIPVREECMI